MVEEVLVYLLGLSMVSVESLKAKRRKSTPGPACLCVCVGGVCVESLRKSFSEEHQVCALEGLSLTPTRAFSDSCHFVLKWLSQKKDSDYIQTVGLWQVR